MSSTPRPRKLPRKYNDCEIDSTYGRRKRIVVETIVADPRPSSTQIAEPPKEEKEDIPPVQLMKAWPGGSEEAEDDPHSSQELVDDQPIPRNSCCFYPRTLIKWLLT